MAGVSKTFIAQTETGHTQPGLDRMERIAAALGVAPTWLAFGPDGGLRFRQRLPRSPVPIDSPEPSPAHRESLGLYKGCGERLRTAREARGMSMRELAVKAGLSNEMVGLTEDGDTVPLVSSCEALAVALDVSPGWLAFGDGEDFTASD